MSISTILYSSIIFLRCAWFCSARAASSVATASDSTTSSAITSSAIQTHTVTVGKLSNQYSPDVVQAAVGDVVEFQFFPPNHSVARAEYQYPCIPYELTGTDKVGFFSGNKPVDAVLDNPPTWNLTINDTEPIFYYCTLQGSCINYAMVGVINPNASVSLETQKQDALKADYMVVPGGKLPTGETLPSVTATPIVTKSVLPSISPSSSSSISSTHAATSTSSPGSSAGKGLSGGAIAGIVIGGVVGLAIVGALLFCFGRHKTELDFLRRDLHRRERQEAPPAPTAQYRDLPPTSPSLRYNADDPRFGGHQPYDVPPYVKPPLSPEPPTPELASVEVMGSRPHSPWSDGGETRRNTASPPPMGLMESIAPEIGHDKFAIDERPEVSR